MPTILLNLHRELLNMTGLAACTLLDGGAAVKLDFADGSSARFHAEWLRDNALDPQTRSPANGQRLLTLAELPHDVSVRRAHASIDALDVEFGPDGKSASYPASWLARHAYDIERSTEPGWLPGHVCTWDASLPIASLSESFDVLAAGGDALAHWLRGVSTHGLALLSGGPLRDGALLDVVSSFGHVRETNYGRLFDVRTEVNPSNLAYTGLGLQAHTDNPYRDPVPTLQLLYCLRNAVDGGESVVVDGFAVAHRLRSESPDAFALLSSHCARFEYKAQDGTCLRARKPLIELAADGELIAVRFNNRSAAPVLDVPYALMPAYYRACRQFAALIDDARMGVRFKLAPGDAFLLDNTRVLHGRTAYASGGERWLQGCYADRDGLLSTLAALTPNRDGRGQSPRASRLSPPAGV